MSYRSGSDDAGPNVTLGDLIRSVYKALIPILICGICAGAGAFIVSSRMPDVYESSVTLLASRAQPSLGTQDLIAPPQVDPRVYNRAVFDGTVAERVYTVVNDGAPTERQLEALKDKITVSIENHDISSVIKISVQDEDNAAAAVYANAVASELVDWDRNRARHMLAETVAGLERVVQELDSELQRVSDSQAPNAASLQVAVATLRDQRLRELEAARLRSSAVVAVGLLEVMSQARASDEPVGPRVLFNTVIATLLGMMVGYGGSLAANHFGSRRLDTRFHFDELDLPLLTVLPSVRDDFSNAVEGLSRLRTEIVRRVGEKLPVVLGYHPVSESMEDSWSSAGLAFALARAGYKTVLVEADFALEKSGFSKRLAGKDGPSLESVLLSGGEQRAFVRVSVGREMSFDLLPTRTTVADPSELLVREFPRLCKALRHQYDFVIVSIAPSTTMRDINALTISLDTVILAYSERTSAAQVADANTFFEVSNVPVLGIVHQTRRSGGRTRAQKDPAGLPWTGHEAGVQDESVARVTAHTGRR